MRKICVRVTCLLMIMFAGIMLIACVDEPVEEFTVTFKSMGGSNVPVVKVAKGSTIAPPTAPTRTNFVFQGWYKEQDAAAACNPARKFNFETTTITQSITLFAGWQGKSVLVRFEVLYDGGKNPDGFYVAYNQKYSQITEPSRPGATFGGWWTKNGTLTDDWGYQINSGSTNTNTENHTLYARWYFTLTVRLDLNDGTLKNSEIPLEYNEVQAGKDAYVTNIPGGEMPDVVRSGFRFDGWWSANGYKGGDDFTGDWGEKIDPYKIIEGGTGDIITIYAKWTRTVTITLEKNGGRGVDDTVGLLPGEEYNLPIPYRPGALFEGWYTKDNKIWYVYPSLDIQSCTFQPAHPDNEEYIINNAEIDTPVMHCSDCNFQVNLSDNLIRMGYGVDALGNLLLNQDGSITRLADFDATKRDLARVPQKPDWGDKIQSNTEMNDTLDHTVYAQWIEDVVRPIVSAGGGITSYVDQKGEMWTWGGQVNNNITHFYGASASTTNLPSNVRGDGGIGVRQAPAMSHLGSRYVQIVSGYNITLAIDVEGKLWGWGRRYNGVLPDVSGGATFSHSTAQHTSPVQIVLDNEPNRKFVDIAINGNHNGTAPAQSSYRYNFTPAGYTYHFYYFALAVEDNGDLWAWGNNNYGQLGGGISKMTSGSTGTMAPFVVNKVAGSPAENHKFEKVSAGLDFSVAITRQDDSNPNQIYSWGAGSNTAGQLGVVSADFRLPMVVSATKFEDVECGDNYTLAVDVKGRLCGWGNNNNGRLGNGITSNTWQTVPIVIKSDKHFVVVAASNGSSFAIDSDGGLWAWGANSNYQLGLGHTNAQSTPIKVPSVSSYRFVAISVGSCQTVFQPPRSTYHKSVGGYWGTYYCDASNTSTTYRFNAVAVALDGSKHGNVYGWGNNDFGQVGNNQNGTHATTPVCLNGYASEENFGR